jgi:hypothetical protein
MEPSNSWAVITPSYRGDLERCKLLCESMDFFLSGPWHHYIIVEKHDLELFRSLVGPRRTTLEMETLLPKSIYHLTRIPFINHRSLWFSWRTGFMIGWQIQQIIKLEMAFRVPDEGLLYCDSDVFFVRALDVSRLSENGAYRFYASYFNYNKIDAPNPTYIEASAEQLGLTGQPFPSPSYVDNLVSWHAPTVRQLCAHIGKVFGGDWKIALGRHYIISEYNLYGMFVDRLLEDRTKIASTYLYLCKTAWTTEQVKLVELETFCQDLEPAQVALGFQSFLGVKLDPLRAEFQRAKRRAQSVPEC